jgi:hypothetical protein
MSILEKSNDIFEPAGPDELKKREEEAPLQNFIVSVNLNEYYRVRAVDEQDAKDRVANGEAKMIDSEIIDVYVNKDT